MDMEHQYQGLIDRLKARVLPREYIDVLTVGTGFEAYAATLLRDIASLKTQESVLIRIIMGNFGAGKSHMLAYLHNELMKQSPVDFLMSSVDLGKTARSMQRGFEFQIMKGLHSQQHATYQEVFAEAYNRIMINYKQQNPHSSNLDARNFVRNLLMTIVSGVVVSVSVSGGAALPVVGLAAIGTAPALESTLKYGIRTIENILEWIMRLTSRHANAFSSSVKTGSDQKRIEFVDAFSRLAQNPKQNTHFEALAKALSDEGILVEVIFKILKQAGYKTVVILTDELEALKQEFDSEVARALTPLREFHDDLDRSGNEYPAVALIAGATREFINDTLRTDEPALYSRWIHNVRELPPLTNADIDQLILKLNHVFMIAGRPVEMLSRDEINAIRDQINSEFIEKEEIKTARAVIGRIIEIIEDERIKQV